MAPVEPTGRWPDVQRCVHIVIELVLLTFATVNITASAVQGRADRHWRQRNALRSHLRRIGVED